MIHSKKIKYPEYTILIDYYDDSKQLVVIVKDADGMIIEGINTTEETDNERLN